MPPVSFIPTHSRSWLCSLVVISALLAAKSALAQDSEAIARSHFQLGRAYYDNGDFDKAAEEFEAAYKVSGRPALLYNIYLAYRDANDMENATRALREYLEKEQDIPSRRQLETRLKIMQEALSGDGDAQAAPQPTPQPAAAPEPTTTPDPTPEPEPEAEPEPELAPAATAEEPASTDLEMSAAGHTDGDSALPILPIALMAGGGAMVVGSIITGVMASSAQSELEDGCPTRMNCSAELADTQASGETLALVTDILLFGGIAVAGTGVALFLLDAGGSTSDSDPSVAVACVPGLACGGSMRVAF